MNIDKTFKLITELMIENYKKELCIELTSEPSLSSSELQKLIGRGTS